MLQNPIFITVTGQKSGAKVRINLNNVTKYRDSEDGGTYFFTYKDDRNPYMIAQENISVIDKLIDKAIENQIAMYRPAPYTLKP